MKESEKKSKGDLFDEEETSKSKKRQSLAPEKPKSLFDDDSNDYPTKRISKSPERENKQKLILTKNRRKPAQKRRPSALQGILNE